MKSILDQNNSIRQIKNGAIISYITIFVNILTSLLVTPLIVSSIGKEHYGLYILVTSLISIFVLDFGLGAAVNRFTSKLHAENNQEAINQFLGIVYKLFLIIDILILMVLTIGYFLLDLIYSNFSTSDLEIFKLIYIIAALFSVISFPFITLNGILSAYERFIYLKICDLFQKVLLTTLILMILFADLGIIFLVLVNGISAVVVMIIKLIIIKKEIPVKVKWSFRSKKVLKEIFGFSVWVTIGSIASRLMFSITPTILGVTTGPIGIAIFGIAALIEGYTFTIANALNSLFFPKISRIIKDKKENQDILPLMIKVGRIQFAIIGLLTIGFILLGKEFIILWMGEAFITAYYCAVILILPAFFSLPQEIANTTAIAANKVKEQSYVYTGMAIINVPLAIILSSKFGVFGAALSIGLSYFFRTISMNVLYYKVLKINIFTFCKECYLKMLPSMLLTLIASYIVINLIPYENIFGFLLKGSVVFLIYFTSLWILSFNTFEKNILGDLFNKFVYLK